MAEEEVKSTRPQGVAPAPTPKANGPQPGSPSLSAPANKPEVGPKPKGKAADDKEMVFVWPHLVSIEAIASLFFIFSLSLMSLLVNAPLRNLANPELTPNPSKAPWYFLGLQELLLHMHPALAGVIVPTAVLILLAAIPYIDSDRRGSGYWFSTRNGVRITVFAALYTMVWELALIILDEFIVPVEKATTLILESGEKLSVSPGVHWMNPHGLSHGIKPLFLHLFGRAPLTVAIGEIFIPSLLMVLIPYLLWHLIKRRYQANTRELMISMYSFFIASFVLLTIIGTAFRGHSMALMWPWHITPPIGI